MPGHVDADYSKHFATNYPSMKLAPVADSHFRYDPSLGDKVAADDGRRMRPWHMLSSLGIGTYLGAADDDTDEQVVNAVISTIAHGCNVIDSARNYRDGRGEESVGRALHAVTSQGIRRQALFVSTKAGFIPGQLKDQLLAAGSIQEGDVLGGNCMHPACLSASLDQSLTALTLQTVDLLYLHNAAEMQLEKLGKERFMSRLRSAFQALEKFRQEGKILAYGLATWSCFRVPPSDPEHLPLQEVVDLAAEVGGQNNGLRYVQLPINAGMREAWEQAWQPLRQGAKAAGDKGSSKQYVSLTTAAARLGIGIFASGPLGEASLLRNTALLAKLQSTPEMEAMESPAVAALQFVRSTPYITAAIVGHKAAAHVQDNLGVVQQHLLTHEQFYRVAAGLTEE